MPWTELTGTKLADAALWCGNAGAAAPPLCLPKDFPASGLQGDRSGVIEAWVSGAFDTTRNELVIPRGGGHADWPGNQVLVCKPGATPVWQLRKNAYPNPPTIFGSPPPSLAGVIEYAPGEPSSVHTYDSICYMPTVDKFLCAGGIYWSPGGESTPEQVFWWDPVANVFTKKAIRPAGYGVACAWDPVGNRVLMRGGGVMLAYDPQLEVAGPNQAAWTTLFTQSTGITEGSNCVLDAINRKLYRIDRRTASKPTAGLVVIDLNNLAAKETKVVTTGDVEIETYLGDGLLYHDGRLIAVGGLAGAATDKFNTYIAVVEGRGGPGQPGIQWVKDPVTATQPPSYRNLGLWKKFFGPMPNGKFYLVNQLNVNIWEYTPDWSATTVTLDAVTDLTVEVL